MNKTILILITALSLSPTAFAVPGEGGYYGQYPEHKLDHMSKELSLSTDQKTKLEAIFKEQHEKFRAIHEDSHNRIKEVLNADQIAKWEQIINHRKEKHHGNFDESQK